MSNELSELIALSCADLTAPADGGTGEIQLILDAERRLSIKQMTATELTKLRAAAAGEVEAQARAEAEAKTRALLEEQLRLAAQVEATARARSAAEEEKRQQQLEEQNRERNAEQQLQHVLEAKRKKQVEEEQSRESSSSPKSASRDRLDEAQLFPPSAANATSGDDSSSPTSQLVDTLELLRSQRAARGASSQQRSRGRSPSPPDARNRERSAAPERLHSSSISSINSASVSDSRRGSTASAFSTNEPTVEVTPKFPLSKTVSAPDIINRRRSSLTNLFPGPSPLVAPEPTLHTNPEVPPPAATQNRQEDDYREIPSGKMVHRTKTPPPVGAKLGVCLKRVTAPSGSITVKPKEGPMLGVVLRKVEKVKEPQKSILDDDKPLYHLSIVRSDNKEHKPAAKPKPKPAAAPPKPSPGGILTGPQVVRTVNRPAVTLTKPQRPQIGVPITITKIEGDKIIIIKKSLFPRTVRYRNSICRLVMFVSVSLYLYGDLIWFVIRFIC